MIDQPTVLAGSVKPELLQGMMMVLLFSWYVGGVFGTCATTAAAPSAAARKARILFWGVWWGWWGGDSDRELVGVVFCRHFNSQRALVDEMVRTTHGKGCRVLKPCASSRRSAD